MAVPLHAFAHRAQFLWRLDGIASSLLLIGSNDGALFGEIVETAAERNGPREYQ
jgi:hypothetical protein